ncbi:tetratricopeptide repeat protein [Mangrovimonas aestuarii]|uniref:tetratricopeptide repeat protein n=1 Tax=Mangrovimonas aestuarii TaxID=3018443 RepID=UPI002378BAE0|nr:hypothetical protein [Mangrovimonas aestuarii]
MDFQSLLKIDFRNIEFYRIRTILLFVIFSSIIFQFVNPFLKDVFNTNIYGVLIWFAFEVVLIIYWKFKRERFPKTDCIRQNIIIAIEAEDDEQERRIKNDFAKGIKKQLEKYNLDQAYEVIVLNNHLSLKVKKKISHFKGSKEFNEKEEYDSFIQFSNKLNASFYVFGDLAKRKSKGLVNYFLDIEALILHSKLSLNMEKKFRMEFSELWKREITFLEEDELNGFKDNSEHIFFTATYMIGLATFASNDFEKSIKIWDALNDYIRGHSDISSYHEKVNQLKKFSLILAANYCYFNGEIEKSVSYRKKYLEISPNAYNEQLTESINCVMQNKLELALKHIEKASELVEDDGDGTWRYNKLYVLISLKKSREAIDTLNSILSNSYAGEKVTVDQVIQFNRTMLSLKSEHIQSHFILGVFLFKKENNAVLAYGELESFISFTDESGSWGLLHALAKEYIKEIESIIGVES